MAGAENRLELLLRYGKLAAAGPFRHGTRLPEPTLERHVAADFDQLASYSRVCGFDLTDTMPVTYPHVLAFGDTLRLLALPDFPFAAIGLIHVGTQIEQLRPIGRTEQLTLRSRLGGLEEHRRGYAFDVLVQALVGDTVVWHSANRYLHLTRSGSSTDGNRAEALRPEPQPVQPTAHWSVPPDIGRRYAAVSGDPNPIHLHPVGALLGGRRRPIAHGMWLLARCVAALADRLPAAYRVEVSFRRAVRLPSHHLGFAVREARNQNGADTWTDSHQAGWDFQLRDLAVARASSVRLTGSVLPAESPSTGLVR